MTVIAVVGWKQYQHYKDRSPTWIKLHQAILTSEAWVLGTDTSRLVQIASMLLAARYDNRIPYRYDLIRKVSHLEMNERQFTEAVRHLVETKFLEIQQLTKSLYEPEQHASERLAKCSSEERREEERRGEKRVPTEPVGQEPDGDPVARVFDHWRSVHAHPKANLDTKRRRLIRAALESYSEADLCQAITGYKNSPHHMGQNERSTVYDDIELMLRDAKHVDAGLRFYAEPPRTNGMSTLTRRNVEATADWVPPEMRGAAN